MSHQQNQILINENEDLSDASPAYYDVIKTLIGQKDDKSTNKLKNALDTIGRKKSNNKIGYAQFTIDENLIKVYIFPKTIKVSNDTEVISNKLSQFTNYIKQYYKLRNTYPDLFKSIFLVDNTTNNISNESLDGCNDVEDILLCDYEQKLAGISNFFKHHQAYISQQINFDSQSLKHKLNLKKNLTSINKSKIHQFKTEDFIYSRLASIALSVLNKFQYKLFAYESIEKDIKKKSVISKLVQDANSIKKFVKSKFRAEKEQITIHRLLQNDIRKLFKGYAKQELFNNLIYLLCSQHIEEKDGNIDQLEQIDNLSMIFFAPDKMYEMIVYDYYANKGLIPNYQNKTTYFASADDLPNGHHISDGDSNPDLVIKDNNKHQIIDAKWKILKLKNVNQIDSIDINDITKLHRDYMAYKYENSDASIECYLCYPQLEGDFDANLYEDIEKQQYKLNYDFDFTFRIKMIETK